MVSGLLNFGVGIKSMLVPDVPKTMKIKSPSLVHAHEGEISSGDIFRLHNGNMGSPYPKIGLLPFHFLEQSSRLFLAETNTSYALSLRVTGHSTLGRNAQ